MPHAIDSAPASPVRMPVASSAAEGVSTRSATPIIPETAAPTASALSDVPSSTRESRITTSGWIAPTVAATPPGSLYALINNSHQKIEKLSPPSTSARSHHTPCGRRLTSSMSKSPAGRALMSATVRGYPAGSISVVTKYVEPQTAGAMAVRMTFAERDMGACNVWKRWPFVVGNDEGI